MRHLFKTRTWRKHLRRIPKQHQLISSNLTFGLRQFNCMHTMEGLLLNWNHTAEQIAEITDTLIGKLSDIAYMEINFSLSFSLMQDIFRYRGR